MMRTKNDESYLLYTWHVSCRVRDMAAIRKLPSGHYQVRWRDHGGHEQGKTVPTKRLADQLRATVELEKSRGVVSDPDRGRVPLADYIANALETQMNLRPATVALYETQARLYIVPGLGDIPLRVLDPARIRAFYGKLRRDGVGVPTVEVVHRLLSRVLNQALDDGLIESNPASRVSAPRAERKPPRVLTVAEVVQIAFAIDRPESIVRGRDFRAGAQLVADNGRTLKKELRVIADVCSTDAERLRYFCMNNDARCEFLDSRGSGDGIWPTGYFPSHVGHGTMTILAAFTGLRFGEVTALRWPALKLDGERPRVEVTEAAVEVRGRTSIGPTKTKGSRRSVPIPKPIVEVMRHYTDSWGSTVLDREFVFEVGSRSNFRNRAWAPAVEFTQLDPAPNFHDLRHSYAAWLIAQARNPKTVQERLGHASIRTTLDVYGHLMENLESEQDSLMDDFLNRENGGTYVARSETSPTS
jgi:integrase